MILKNKIEIIHEPTENEPFIILIKPSLMPSAPIERNDNNNAIFYASKLFPEINSIKGIKEIEYGLLHRIDNVTSGLLLIATNQFFYDQMLISQKEGKFIKTYRAECEYIKANCDVLKGFPLKSPEVRIENDFQFSVSSLMRFYNVGRKEVRPVEENEQRKVLSKVDKKKIYTTKIKIASVNSNKICVECSLKEGFKHQVRCHLSWCNLPILNDTIYNSNCVGNNNLYEIKFCASGLNFINPLNNTNVRFEL